MCDRTSASNQECNRLLKKFSHTLQATTMLYSYVKRLKTFETIEMETIGVNAPSTPLLTLEFPVTT